MHTTWYICACDHFIFTMPSRLDQCKSSQSACMSPLVGLELEMVDTKIAPVIPCVRDISLVWHTIRAKFLKEMQLPFLIEHSKKV
eukprot:5413782-Amphidinium_carterae.1